MASNASVVLDTAQTGQIDQLVFLSVAKVVSEECVSNPTTVSVTSVMLEQTVLFSVSVMVTRTVLVLINLISVWSVTTTQWVLNVKGANLSSLVIQATMDSVLLALSTAMGTLIFASMTVFLLLLLVNGWMFHWKISKHSWVKAQLHMHIA